MFRLTVIREIPCFGTSMSPRSRSTESLEILL